MTITCSGCSCGEHERWPVVDAAQASEAGGEFDGAAVVDGVVVAGDDGDEDHGVPGVPIQPRAGIPAEFA